MNQPNILMIMADQLRFDWLGYAGASWVKTPHLDALAEESAQFTHCFTNSPVCGPARISFATGLLPHRTGATSNKKATLAPSVPTHYAWFRDHSYRVELIGRHDLHKPGAPGSIYGTHPRTKAYGFTHSIEVEGACSAANAVAKKGVTGPYTAHLKEHGLLKTYADDYQKRKDSGWYLGGNFDSALPVKHHQDVFIADLAIDRLHSMEDDFPWYMQINFQTPHDPFDPPSEYAKAYRDQPMPKPVESTAERPSFITKRQTQFSDATEEEITIARQQYGAKITLLDDQVGRILKAIDSRGERSNTIIVFTSDHGEQLGDLDLFSKHTAYDPSWRVPLLISGPNIHKQSSQALVELSDLGPTLVHLAGLPPQKNLDAISFASVLQSKTDQHRQHCVCIEDGYQAIRSLTQKYIRYDDGQEECFDLIADPLEQHPISSSNSFTKLSRSLATRLAPLNNQSLQT